MFKSMGISASGMTLQRLRMDVIAQNIANMNTTRTANGGPYRRRLVTVQEDTVHKPFSKYFADSKNAFGGCGIKATSIVEDSSPFKRVYEPSHPDADEEGYVLMPNVDNLKEMVDMISAWRSFEANVTAFNAAKSMAIKGLDIGRR